MASVSPHTKEGGKEHAAKVKHHGVSHAFTRNTTKTLGPRTGPAAYARAVRRYNITTKAFIGRNGKVFHKRAVTEGGEEELESEVPAHSVQNDLEYVVQVKVGTPGVIVNLDFDTGSSDLWIWSSELRTSTAGHNIYNPDNSSTAKIIKGAKWKIQYGDGSSASGNVFTDTITIGEDATTAVSIPNQAIELAQNLSQSFLQDGGSDGLLGLAWPVLNTVTPKAQATPVDNMIKEKIITQPVFTASLDKLDDNGFYTFGIIDAARAGVSESDIKYTPIDNSRGFWMFSSTSITINGKTIKLAKNTSIADTGTTLALLSPSVVSTIYASIPGSKFDQSQGGYVYPSDAPIPDVSIAVGDHSFKIKQEDFSLGPVGDEGDGIVFGGIQSRGNNYFDILGDVFLKSVYVVFDQGSSRIGMAQR